MRNEINLFDMLLAKKLGGGGGAGPKLRDLAIHGNGTYEPTDTTYAWKKVIVNASLRQEYITAASPSQVIIPKIDGVNLAKYAANQYISFTINSQTTGFPISMQTATGGENYSLYGGGCDSTGNGAVLYAYGAYDIAGLTIGKALMIQNGSVIDITQYAQSGMSNIRITRERVRNKTDD